MDRFVAWRPTSRHLLFVGAVALALALIAVAALTSGVDFNGSQGRTPGQLPARGASVVSVEFPDLTGLLAEELLTATATPSDPDTGGAVEIAPGSDGSDGSGGGGGSGDDGLTGIEPVDEAVNDVEQTVDDTADVLPVEPPDTGDTSTVTDPIDEVLDETLSDPTSLLGSG